MGGVRVRDNRVIPDQAVPNKLSGQAPLGELSGHRQPLKGRRRVGPTQLRQIGLSPPVDQTEARKARPRRAYALGPAERLRRFGRVGSATPVGCLWQNAAAPARLTTLNKVTEVRRLPVDRQAPGGC
jgi:hypothetical protein